MLPRPRGGWGGDTIWHVRKAGCGMARWQSSRPQEKEVWGGRSPSPSGVRGKTGNSINGGTRKKGKDLVYKELKEGENNVGDRVSSHFHSTNSQSTNCQERISSRLSFPTNSWTWRSVKAPSNLGCSLISVRGTMEAGNKNLPVSLFRDVRSIGLPISILSMEKINK